MAPIEKNAEGQPTLDVIATGISGLDAIMGGGIPRGAFILVAGEPGTGKTVLAQQICSHWARQQGDKGRRKAIYFSTISEPHEKLIAHVSKFDFYDPSQIPDQMEIISLQDAMSHDIAKVAETIVASARQRKAGLVVIDGFRSLISVASSLNHAAMMLSQLSSQLNFLGCTLIVTLEQNYEHPGSGELMTTSDCIIALYQQRVGAHIIRRLEVPKMRGVAQLGGLHSYVINKQGWHVYPRFETLINAEGLVNATVLPDQRQSFGVTEFDRLMHGGVPKGSITMVAGSPSTGKTLLALHYLNQGTIKGQAGLLLNFGETHQQLIDKAERFNLPLAQALTDGSLRLHNIIPVEIDPDYIAQIIRDEVEKHNIQRLVIDGIDELERSTQPQQRTYDYIAALLAYVRSRGVTLCVTKNVPRIIGSDLDLGDTPFALLGENLLLLRYIERDNRLLRSVLVLKMRDSTYDQTIRQFSITDKGIEAMEKLQLPHYIEDLAGAVAHGVMGEDAGATALAYLLT